MADSDDEDTFVTLGTSVDVPDTDEPLKKPVSFQDLPVKDSKGRVRFHGAFTGGFSAGYFNTVGTQEGWTPSTFVSSRNERSKPTSNSQRPEDFMDEDDLGEHGIAPRKYVTSSAFASEERRKRRHDEAKLATSDSTLLGHTDLLNLIVPERITIGVKLLRKMGWKEGQGVGPRLKRQSKKKKGKTKVYGCELPPSDEEDDDDFDDESVLKDVTFAPKDSSLILMNPKDDTKGLGYRGLDPRKALPSSHINLFSKSVGSKSGKRGIRGQAFGVGALEEDDDDIYSVDDRSNYDMTMTMEDEDETFGWTGSKRRGQSTTPVGYVGKLLEGFTLSSQKLIQKKEFPPPKLPKHFRPIHVFIKAEKSDSSSMESGSGIDYRMFMKPQDSADGPEQSGQKKQATDSVTRSLALGEQPFVGSVFDLIPDKDKKKMENVKSGMPMEAETSNTGESGPSVMCQVTGAGLSGSAGVGPSGMAGVGSSGSAGVRSSESAEAGPPESAEAGPSGSAGATRSSAPLYQGGGLGFKPFTSDKAKQERYDKYLSILKQGLKDPYHMVAAPGQTEWEMEREREEFSHAARLFKPLATMMAMRFTSAGVEDKLVAVKQDVKAELSEPAKAAEMKMYGKLTREVSEWHPDKLVCKRFNVPDPYPQSNVVGLAGLKRDKYSVFNFLTFANPTEADRNQKQPDTDNNTTNNKTDSNKSDLKTEHKKESILKPRPSSSTQGLKSIFTHLVDGTKNSKPKSDSLGGTKTGLSFNIKSKGAQKPEKVDDDGKKDEDGSTVSKQVPLAEVFDLGDEGKQAKADNKKTGEPDNPDMDLFRAIFKNTDSESSSDEEEISNIKPPKLEPPEMDSSKMETDVDSNQIVAAVSNPDSESRLVIKTEKDRKENMDITAPFNQVCVLPGSGENIPSIAQRLSPNMDDSDDSEAYGPALPPPTVGNAAAGYTSKRDPSTGENFIDLTKGSSHKHKHRHKDKHKSKKEKKAKYKKSKHKKKDRKKKKHKDRGKSDTDNTDTTDKDTDSDADIPSDKDLLQKMKMLKPGQRMRAADFL